MCEEEPVTRVKLAIMWDQAPEKGRVEVAGGTLVTGGINIGWGEYEDGVFSFSQRDACKIVFAIDTDKLDDDADPTTVRVTDTAHPLSFALRDAIADHPVSVHKSGVRARAEKDLWAKLGGGSSDPANVEETPPVPAELARFETFTKEQIEQFGPVRRHDVLRTERHVYISPFMYENVDVGDIAEVDPTKGIELMADTGYIAIREEQPIVGVTVVGSGCKAHGYNICE